MTDRHISGPLPLNDPSSSDAPPAEASVTSEGAGEFDRSDWRCLECDYSLAHTVEDRCPECGAWFAPADMAAMALDRALPSYPWEVRSDWGAWRETCELVVLRGEEFVGRMSLVPDVVAAMQFSLRSNAVAVAGPALLACVASAIRVFDAPELSVSVLTGTLMIGAIWFSTRLALEFVLVALFRLGLTPRGRRNGIAVWSAIVHYHSSHAVATSILFLVGLVFFSTSALIAMGLDGPGVVPFVVAFLIGGGEFIIGMLWFSGVLSCARRLSRPSPSRILTLALSALIMLPLVMVSIFGLAATVGLATGVVVGRY